MKFVAQEQWARAVTSKPICLSGSSLPVYLLQPQKEPGNFSEVIFCILFTLAQRTTNLDSFKILVSAKEICTLKTSFSSSMNIKNYI